LQLSTLLSTFLLLLLEVFPVHVRASVINTSVGITPSNGS